MGFLDNFLYGIDGDEMSRVTTIICAEMYKKHDCHMNLRMLGRIDRFLEIEYLGEYSGGWKVSIEIDQLKSIKKFSYVSETNVKKWLYEIAKDYHKNPEDYDWETIRYY